MTALACLTLEYSKNLRIFITFLGPRRRTELWCGRTSKTSVLIHCIETV